jgi:hypothetical protein
LSCFFSLAAECSKIEAQYETNKAKVISMLLHHVTHVKLEMSEAMVQAIKDKEAENQQETL